MAPVNILIPNGGIELPTDRFLAIDTIVEAAESQVLTLIAKKKSGDVMIRPVTLKPEFLPTVVESQAMDDVLGRALSKVKSRTEGYVNLYDLSKSSWLKVCVDNISFFGKI